MASSTWQPMRNPADDLLPPKRGIFVVQLEPPIVLGSGHFVHLSWRGGDYILRDFLHEVERRQGDDLLLEAIWNAAKVRIPCKGRLRHVVGDHVFWRDELRRLTDEHTLRASPHVRTTPRPLGTAQGLGHVPDSFFEPLPSDILAAFNGEDP